MLCWTFTSPLYMYSIRDLKFSMSTSFRMKMGNLSPTIGSLRIACKKKWKAKFILADLTVLRLVPFLPFCSPYFFFNQPERNGWSARKGRGLEISKKDSMIGRRNEGEKKKILFFAWIKVSLINSSWFQCLICDLRKMKKVKQTKYFHRLLSQNWVFFVFFSLSLLPIKWFDVEQHFKCHFYLKVWRTGWEDDAVSLDDFTIGHESHVHKRLFLQEVVEHSKQGLPVVVPFQTELLVITHFVFQSR